MINWTFFDQISCINLYTRDDRMIESMKVFKKLNIPVEFQRFHKHPTDGKKGCYESHLSVIRDAYSKGCKNVLIFEDDIIESPYFKKENIDQAIEFMKNNKTWEIFYLGHSPDILYKTTTVISENILHVSSTLTHAYVMSRKYMKKIINQKYNDIAIDKIYLENKESYAIYPMQFYQNESDSDIINSSPIRGLRYSEIYAYYINYPILYFLFLFFSLILLIFSIKIIEKYI